VVRQNQVLSRAIKQLLHWVEEEIRQPDARHQAAPKAAG
jgi:hypothetical protein